MTHPAAPGGSGFDPGGWPPPQHPPPYGPQHPLPYAPQPVPHHLPSSRMTELPGWAIALIAAGATLVVVAVLAALAVPTFLDQRARAAAPQIPERIGELTRSHAPEVESQVQQMADDSRPYLADVQGALFVDGQGAPAVFVVTGRPRPGADTESFESSSQDFLAGVKDALPEGHRVGPLVTVDPGRVGGQIVCADVLSPSGQTASQACFSRTDGAYVSTVATGGADLGLIIRVRDAVLPAQ